MLVEEEGREGVGGKENVSSRKSLFPFFASATLLPSRRFSQYDKYLSLPSTFAYVAPFFSSPRRLSQASLKSEPLSKLESRGLSPSLFFRTFFLFSPRSFEFSLRQCLLHTTSGRSRSTRKKGISAPLSRRTRRLSRRRSNFRQAFS